MRRSVAALSAHRGAEDQWHFDLPVVHPGELGRMVHPLVSGQRKKVAEHDLDDGPISAQCQAVSNASDRRLADRGVANPVWKVLAQACGHLERTAIGRFHVFADNYDLGVSLQRLCQRTANPGHHSLLVELDWFPDRLSTFRRGSWEATERSRLRKGDGLVDPLMDLTENLP